jgi:hypothetical protein
MERQVPARQWVRAARIPLAFALGCSIYVLVVDVATDGAALSRLPLSLKELIAFYFMVAVIATVAIRLLGGSATTRGRAAGIGFITGMLIAVAVNYTFGPAVIGEPLGGYKLLGYAVFLGLPGAFTGAIYWTPPE